MKIKDPYECINFTKRHALIKDKDGNIIFDEEVEFPDFFSDNAVNIVSSKYLCNSAKRKETSVKDMIDRVSETITEWGIKDNYFNCIDESTDFQNKLKKYQINQLCAFNSPVYFNIGLEERPMLSACYTLIVEDNMESLYDNLSLESKIFKGGAGAGKNWSHVRSSKERVRGGGFASGPLSYLATEDVSAGRIKSGGTIRRSAKLACLNMDHPDIVDFINCKDREEKKLKLLKDNNIKPAKGYELSDDVFYQNTNLSTCNSDAFMNAVISDKEWNTKYVLTGETCKTFKAKDLLMQSAINAWKYGCPGVQFSDTINRWNTCKNYGWIESSNPCGEYFGFNSCNLASINTTKFFYFDKNGKCKFDYDLYSDVIKTIITAQDIIIDNAKYPSDEIAESTKSLRPLGLGFTNLHGMLMMLGIPYDSVKGRNLTSLLTALLTGIAYLQSNELAEKIGEFSEFDYNKNSFYEVIYYHKYHVNKLYADIGITDDIFLKVGEIWAKLENLINKEARFRNSQVTLMAPTGTTSFLMDADTFGIEPAFSLVSHKTLSGSNGSTIKIITPIVKESLINLGYSCSELDILCDELKNDEHFENSKILKPEHLPIFDTASKPKNGNRLIDYMAHVKMIAAIQPFISGGVSKTANLPNSATVEDIYNLYIEAWKMGLKGITVYRDGSKTFQPLSNNDNASKSIKEIHTGDIKGTLEVKGLSKEPLDYTRSAENHKFYIGSIKGYLTSGVYGDGRLGEIFLRVSKEGSTLSGLLDSLAIMISLSLQYGVPLRDIVDALMFSRFEPSGITRNSDIRFATSIVDYIARYIGLKYLSEEDQISLGLKKNDLQKIENQSIINDKIDNIIEPKVDTDSSPICDNCGSIMNRLGSCYNCNNCGANSGVCG
jgi:ribonucleoside-diphosphate reductase alpha chain